jgi:hypothetical protein
MTSLQKIIKVRVAFLDRQQALIPRLAEVGEDVAKAALAAFKEPNFAGHWLTTELRGYTIGIPGIPADIVRTKKGRIAVLKCLDRIRREHYQ